MYKVRVHPEAIDGWPYWEFEFYLDQYKDWLEKEKAAAEGDGGAKSGEQLTQGKVMKDMQNQMGKSMGDLGKIPGAPAFKMPDFGSMMNMK